MSNLRGQNEEDILEGTTRRVFSYIYRQKGPVGVRETQRGLNFSSPSVAQYHIAKLLRAGLLREEGGGYVADKVVFENMLKIRRSVLPLQATYAAFFLTALLILLTVLRPSPPTSLYFFAVTIAIISLGVAVFEAYKVLRRPY
jgi:hypothetical protein